MSRFNLISGALGAVALLATAGLQPTWAGDLTVRALDKGSGAPLRDAAICLGTSANLRQMGAVRSDRQGEAVFQAVPDAPLVVTVSKEGFRGERRGLQGGRTDAVTVLLPQGGGGPGCQAAAAAPSDDLLDVERFRIAEGQSATRSRDVALSFSAAGGATHWRAAESPDLGRVPWQELGGQPPRFQLSGEPGPKRVYLQLRKFRDVMGASLESFSEPVSDTIELRP